MASIYGFCMGVELAIKAAEELTETKGEGEKIYSIGAIVHNSRVVNELSDKGLEVIKRPEDGVPGKALIRAHGIPKDLKTAFLDSGYTLVDGTCLIVKKNIENCASATCPVLFFGTRNHAEVLSSVSYINTPYWIIEEEEDLERIDSSLSYDAIIQTTFSSFKVEQFKAKLKEMGVRVRYRNSVCAASTRRRNAVSELCSFCDVVLVMGDRHSANTTELYNLAKREGVRAYMILNVEDLCDDMIADAHDVGLCAGASVPPRYVKELEKQLEALGGMLVVGG